VIGQQLGNYVVLTELGRGGMGDVYVAQDTRLDRRVALKLPRRDITASVDRLRLFQREARAAAALNHPNIVHLYSVEEADGLIFMTMELVQGRTLREILRAGAPLALPQVFAFTSQIAEGLACAHAAGVLHRDLKPGNVMITDDDRVKILDFGVAKFFNPVAMWDQEAATTTRKGSTTTREVSSGGTTVGTVGYMSPEQALGKTLDARTDLFALGVMLFEMATGRAPFVGDTPAAIFDHLLNRQPLSAMTLNPELPATLADIIEKALEKDPERRYRSANGFWRICAASTFEPRSAVPGFAGRQDGLDGGERRGRARSQSAGLNRRAAFRRLEPGAGSK
jgi:serine/threonine protein kinase